MDFLTFFSDFGTFASSIFAFIVALSIIVFVHEFGHYIVGRWCGVSAEIFSLGMGPVLWFRMDQRGTKWQVAVLPFGGYVKFAGDADVTSVGAQADMSDLIPKSTRHTLDGAPLWARTLTVAAGPFFNFGFSILIFASFFMTAGIATDEAYVGKVKDLGQGVQTLQKGDLILSIDGQPVLDLLDLYKIGDALTPQRFISYQLRRNGVLLDVVGPYPFPTYVDRVQPQSAALAAGVHSHDLVVAVDGDPVFAFAQLVEKVKAGDGAPMELTLLRSGQELEVNLTPKQVDLPKADGGFERRWLLGLSGGLAFDPLTRRTGPFEGVWLATKATYSLISKNLSGIGHLVTGKISSCNISGPIRIAQVSGDMARDGASVFFGFVAMLSTAIGLMNLFPIPVLDGGHLVLFGYEALSRKKPSPKVIGILMRIGMIVLLSLMAFAFTNDLIFCP
ncbi:MAG: regulator of sigma E protease [Paracoccaceae bacterium]